MSARLIYLLHISSLEHNINMTGIFSDVVHLFAGKMFSFNLCNCVDKKNQLDVTFVYFISLLIVAQHVSGNHVPIIRS